ncbi:uncharacterized protein [Miscanthus floridulus]|uniref:uncharacterized protein isoform X2 n=1 Tax=Miscanthus floridulus TaxID=154761 RepID=UPI00345AA847
MAPMETYARDDDAKLEATRARLSNILRRHEDLKERLSQDSDKLIFERLQKEFEAARAAQTEEISIDDEEWNDGLLATIREKTRSVWRLIGRPWPTKLMFQQIFHFNQGLHIGLEIRLSIAWMERGLAYSEPCEIFHCVLESKSFLEKMIVIEHTLPFFLPVRELESDLLSSNSIKFIDHLEEILQAYIDRREQVRLIKELYGNQIGELFHSLPYNMIEFVLEDFECKVTISIRYSDILQTLPSQARVLAWALHSAKRISTRSSSASAAQPVPFHLSYAEEALKTLCLPEAYADIVLELPHALKRIFSSRDSD